MNEIKKYTEEEKLQAAYVLNLCTVSVSQIVDYNDEYILEQEYEAILNNLNLEQVPKDEALLNILTEILDTVTFFRIYEKKKQMIEKKYQQKVKNAIWNAVPNFGLLIATRDPITMAISLASNVGIGYMNYRQSKAATDLEHENELMNLQITAIEQLNALRRELFTTSWRLADEYGFKDEYRLTERQIAQYNNILMDQDPIRKYKRLDSIKDNFLAYPAFWYYIGNAANKISRIEEEGFSESFREKYRNIAIEHFDYYFKLNGSSVLREDQCVSSCALEYFELLPNDDIDKRRQLLEKAIKWSGMKPDILQICAIDFLRIKDYTNSERILGMLVDEGYNSEINAQILSSVYACHYFEKPSDNLLFDYSLLSRQERGVVLFPLPVQENEGETEIQLWNDFIRQQRLMAQETCLNVINSFFIKYSVEVNGLLMRFDSSVEYPDSFFAGDNKAKRDEEAERVFGNEIRRLDYIDELRSRNYSTEVVNLLNKMLIDMQALPFVSLDEPVDNFREKLRSLTNVFESIQECISTDDVRIETYRDMFEQVEFNKITSSLQELIIEQVKDYFKHISDMKGIIQSEAILQKFCEKSDISLRVEVIDEHTDNPMLDPYKLDPSLVGKTALSLDRENIYRQKMYEKLQAELSKVVKQSDKVDVMLKGDESFDSYFSSMVAMSNDKELLREQALAVLDDRRLLNDVDLIFTFNSVIPIKMKIRHNPAKYKDIQWDQEAEALAINEVLYDNPNVFVKKLGILAQDMSVIRDEFDKL